MLNIRTIFLFIILIVSLDTTLANNKINILPRHFTISAPFSIQSVESYTNNPNFSVRKTSNNTFDALNDYNNSKYTAVKLWVVNGKDKSYVYFSDNQRGPQVVECIGCPIFNKIDSNNYQITFE